MNAQVNRGNTHSSADTKKKGTYALNDIQEHTGEAIILNCY